MKKILIACGILLMLAAGASAARALNGIGIYGNVMGNGTGAGGGLGITLRYNIFPVIGLEWSFIENSSVFGGSLDWWMLDQPLADNISCYIGVGGYAAMTTGNSFSTFRFGGRVPIGIQIFPADSLEVFLEVAPMIILLPSIIDWTASVRLGFRVLY
jgi:hypothetical protein